MKGQTNVNLLRVTDRIMGQFRVQRISHPWIEVRFPRHTVSSKSIGIVKCFVVLAMYSRPLDLKGYNDYEVKVQTINVHLMVFQSTSISGEPFRNYSPFCTGPSLGNPVLGDQKCWDKFTIVQYFVTNS